MPSSGGFGARLPMTNRGDPLIWNKCCSKPDLAPSAAEVRIYRSNEVVCQAGPSEQGRSQGQLAVLAVGAPPPPEELELHRLRLLELGPNMGQRLRPFYIFTYLCSLLK